MLLTHLAFIKNTHTHTHSKYFGGNILYILKTTQCIFDVGCQNYTCNTTHSHWGAVCDLQIGRPMAVGPMCTLNKTKWKFKVKLMLSPIKAILAADISGLLYKTSMLYVNLTTCNEPPRTGYSTRKRPFLNRQSYFIAIRYWSYSYTENCHQMLNKCFERCMRPHVL